MEELQRILDSIPRRKFRTINLFNALLGDNRQPDYFPNVQLRSSQMLGRDYRIVDIVNEIFAATTGGGPVTTAGLSITSQGPAIPGEANQGYGNIANTTNGNGSGILISIGRDNTGILNPPIVTDGGNGYREGDEIYVLGSEVGGVDGVDDVTFTVTQVGSGQPDFTKTFELIDRLPGKEYREEQFFLRALLLQGITQ